MAAPDTNFLTISVSLDTVVLATADFGTPIVVAYTDAWSGNASRTYTDIASVAVDFPSSGVGSATYNACAAILSQNPHPPSVKVARAGAAVASKATIKILNRIAQGSVWKFNICGINVTYTETATETPTTIALALKTAADTALSGLTTQLAATDTITITRAHLNASLPIICTKEMAANSEFAVTTTFGTAANTALDSILAVDGSWYGLCFAQQQSIAQIKLIEAWSQTAQTKFYVFCISEAGERTQGSGDVFFDAKAAAYKYCLGLFTNTVMDVNADAAYLGAMLWRTPGSYTMTFKNLASVPADDITATIAAAVKAQNGNTYQSWRGFSCLQSSLVPYGVQQDTITTVQKIIEDLAVEEATLLTSTPKVPYNDAGRQMVIDAIKRVLERHAGYGAIEASTIKITAPTAASQATADRTARLFCGFVFSAKFTSAIESITVVGHLS